MKFAQLLRELSADLFRNLWMLKKQRALKILPAVQAGAQNEMAIKQRASFSEECEQVAAHCCRAVILTADGGGEDRRPTIMPTLVIIRRYR
jgi:hypothetical protein